MKKPLATRWCSLMAAGTCGIALLLCAPAAWALDVEPARLEVVLAPDQPVTGTLSITNSKDVAVNARIRTGPYRFLQTGITLPSAEAWIAFEPSDFTLAPESAAEVTYTVTPPANIARDTAAEYVAAILVDELPIQSAADKKDRPQGVISIVPRLALPVYVMIEGRQRIELSIEGLTAQHREQVGEFDEFSEEAPTLLWLTTTLRNRGSVHVRPSGTVALFDAEGNVVRVTALGRSMPILPKAALQIPTVLPLPDAGQYKAVITAEADQAQLLQKELVFEVTKEETVVVTP